MKMSNYEQIDSQAEYEYFLQFIHDETRLPIQRKYF